jgi:tRNA modification GTPase
MSIFAAVMTGQGAGAISTIGVFGKNAETVINKIFIPASENSAKLRPGTICLGTITDGSDTIDQVTIGCESKENYTIHCHGNPLIVEMIMQLLSKHKTTLTTAEELLTKMLLEEGIDTITVEAKLACANAKSLAGTKIILNQIESGLVKTAKQWLANMDSTGSPRVNLVTINKIKTDADYILRKSQTAQMIMFGCNVVLAGPPNSGKSTLLNCLAGTEKAVVTNIAGTTRDYVTANCRIGSFSVELTDTAGLDEKTANDSIDRAAQQKAIEILAKADLVLLVLDSSQSNLRLDSKLLEKINNKKVLTVLNKSDLGIKLDIGKLPKILTDTVQISAKFETGIEALIGKMLQFCGMANFDLHQPIVFTPRQENLLKKLSIVKTKQHAQSAITELLNGPLSV